jgi:hypothetical protein
MTHVREMIDSHPARITKADATRLQDCIDAVLDCSQTCTACADACLGERDLTELVSCIRLDLDCADICDITARVLSRRTGADGQLTRAVLDACIQSCQLCAAECERHAAHHAHCRVCAEACRQCEEACRALLATVG